MPGPDRFIGNLYKTQRSKIIHIQPVSEKRGSRLNTFYKANIILILKLDKKCNTQFFNQAHLKLEVEKHCI